MFIGLYLRGSFTINYNKTIKDDRGFIPIPETKPDNNTTTQDVDSPEEIAQKVQEALGVFINDESEQRK